MNSIDRKSACITGATSGIGAEFAKRFAKQEYDLILTGRRKAKLESLSSNLSKKNNINVDVIIAELSDDKRLELLLEKIGKIRNLEILVNNAGFAKNNFFHEEDFLTHEVMLKVHDLALIKLCHAVLPKMISRGKGTIINVSSLSAFTPFPTNAIYAASKAFVKSFTESIYLELQGTGVKVQALCPGMTITDFHERMGFDKNGFYKDKGMMKAMTPEEVVDISLKYLEKDKPLCIPGGHNKLSSFLLKVLPKEMTYKMVSSMMHKRNKLYKKA
jgi:short-subunit dehydrogenase